VLEVRDDGSGIPEERIEDPHSLGLLGIRERARNLGGSASFGRLEPTGTVVTVRLPLAPAS
jgi:signal transduction histidine kinase